MFVEARSESKLLQNFIFFFFPFLLRIQSLFFRFLCLFRQKQIIINKKLFKINVFPLNMACFFSFLQSFNLFITFFFYFFYFFYFHLMIILCLLNLLNTFLCLLNLLNTLKVIHIFETKQVLVFIIVGIIMLNKVLD